MKTWALSDQRVITLPNNVIKISYPIKASSSELLSTATLLQL
uniref:Uncharacterized protein n=1 Tax=Anguilla anguilla TaxID=7936 RepID=A0A0E9VCK1_ANGAN